MKGTLVRDKTPVKFIKDGHEVSVKILSITEFQKALLVELINFAGKYNTETYPESDPVRSNNSMVLAEMETIIRALAESSEINPERVEQVYNNLANRLGVYNARLFMEIENDKTPEKH